MSSVVHPAGGGVTSALFYSHEGMGIGHLRRAITLGQHLHARWPEMRQLVVTSSAATQILRPRDYLDHVKLPAVVRIGPEEAEAPFVARALPISFEAVRDLRRDILSSVAKHFQPDVVFVDYMPAGLKGELVPALRHWRATSPRPRLLLGLRDIPDEAPRIRQGWSQDGAYELLDQLYDRILVYGQRDVYDLAVEAALSPTASAKVRYLGYLRRRSGRPPAQVRAELALRTGRLVLVTVGGGSDGYPVLRAMSEAIRDAPERAGFDCLLVAGPLMPAADRQALRAALPASPTIRLLDAVEELAD
jgi:predicted glycosyltransferase